MDVSVEYLESLRLLGDGPADDVLSILNRHSLGNTNDILEAISVFLSQTDPTDKDHIKVSQFLSHIATAPKWLDTEKIRRGQIFIIRHFQPYFLFTLLHKSLIDGYGLSRVNKVLLATGYLSKPGKAVRRRLAETMQMISDMFRPHGLLPGKSGWKSVVRVRFLHCKIRARLMAMVKGESKLQFPNFDYNVSQYGIPINQEDMMATIIGFSIVAIESFKSKFGLQITRDEVDDFLHLWRYAAFLIGIPDELNPCESEEKATYLNRVIGNHLYKPDETTRILSRSTLESVANEFPHNKPLMFHYRVCVRMISEEWGDFIYPEFKVTWKNWIQIKSMDLYLDYYYWWTNYMIYVHDVLDELYIWIYGSRKDYWQWKANVFCIAGDEAMKRHAGGRTNFRVKFSPGEPRPSIKNVFETDEETLDLTIFNQYLASPLFYSDTPAKVTLFDFLVFVIILKAHVWIPFLLLCLSIYVWCTGSFSEFAVFLFGFLSAMTVLKQVK